MDSGELEFRRPEQFFGRPKVGETPRQQMKRVSAAAMPFPTESDRTAMSGVGRGKRAAEWICGRPNGPRSTSAECVDFSRCDTTGHNLGLKRAGGGSEQAPLVCPPNGQTVKLREASRAQTDAARRLRDNSSRYTLEPRKRRDAVRLALM
jgi:hypothetical protein